MRVHKIRDNFVTLRLTALLAVLALIGLIALYVLEFRWFDRTIGMRSLALYAVAIGALAGAGLGRHFSRQGRNTVEKIQLYLFFIVLCTLFAPFFASLSNRLLSPYPSRPESVEFFEQQAYLPSPYGIVKGQKAEPAEYYTFFYYKGRLRRIKSKHPILSGLERGQTAELSMKRGLWGYTVVVKQGQ